MARTGRPQHRKNLLQRRKRLMAVSGGLSYLQPLGETQNTMYVSVVWCVCLSCPTCKFIYLALSTRRARRLTSFRFRSCRFTPHRTWKYMSISFVSGHEGGTTHRTKRSRREISVTKKYEYATYPPDTKMQCVLYVRFCSARRR